MRRSSSGGDGVVPTTAAGCRVLGRDDLLDHGVTVGIEPTDEQAAALLGRDGTGLSFDLPQVAAAQADGLHLVIVAAPRAGCDRFPSVAPAAPRTDGPADRRLTGPMDSGPTDQEVRGAFRNEPVIRPDPRRRFDGSEGGSSSVGSRDASISSRRAVRAVDGARPISRARVGPWRCATSCGEPMPSSSYSVRRFKRNGGRKTGPRVPFSSVDAATGWWRYR